MKTFFCSPKVEILEDAKVERPTTLVGKRKKRWVDLEQEGFEEKEGAAEDVSETDETDQEEEDEAAQHSDEDKVNGTVAGVEQEEEEEEEKPAGFVDVPEDEAVDVDEDDDIFNTDFAAAAVSGLKLAVIPDSPEEPADGDDPFDTKFAQDIVEKHEKEKKVRDKVESNRVKFGSIAAAADVLTGKADRVDKHAVDHAVRRKRRRANRINLIADEVDDVTALDDIEGISPTRADDEQKDVLGGDDGLEVPVGDLLSSTPSPGPYVRQEGSEQEEQERERAEHQLSEDLREFDVVQKEEVALTSNIALLQVQYRTSQP